MKIYTNYIHKTNEAELDNVYFRIKELSKLDAEDFLGTVDTRVIDTLSTYIRSIYQDADSKIVRPLIASDGCGGLQIEWRGSLDKDFKFYIPNPYQEGVPKMYLYTIYKGKPELHMEPAPYKFMEKFNELILT